MSDETSAEDGRTPSGSTNPLVGDVAGAREIKIREREREMVALRTAGVSVNEIAERYGVHHSRVSHIISRFLRQNRSSAAADLRDVYDKRYEDIIRAHYTAAVGSTKTNPDGSTSRVPGDPKSGMLVLHALGELRKLHGMDKLVIEHESQSQEERAAAVGESLEAYLQGVRDERSRADEPAPG